MRKGCPSRLGALALALSLSGVLAAGSAGCQGVVGSGDGGISSPDGGGDLGANDAAADPDLPPGDAGLDAFPVAKDGPGPFPAVVALHGNGDSATNFLAFSGLGELAPGAGLVVVAPEAIPGSSPVGGVDWDAYTSPPDANRDVQLCAAVQELLAGARNVDPARLYLLGYSQGGFLAYYAAMALADRYAAVHVSAAADPQPGRNLHLSAARPVPVDLLIGTEDFGIDNARFTRDELEAASWPLRYTELEGAGHVPFRSERTGDIVGWLGMHRLP
jgi:polyhydroxybutyrate depolymerase